MPTFSCPACKQPMNAASAVCPHCNARRTDIDPTAVAKQLSPEEIRAMIMVEAPPVDASEGLVSTLVLPHPATRGIARAAELALTVVTLPLVLAGVIVLAFGRRKRRGTTSATRGELTPVLAMAGLGGLGLTTILSVFGVATVSNLAVTGASIAALCVRGAIRARAAASRGRDLHRLPAAIARPAK